MTARDVIERHLNQKAGLVLTSEANADAILAALAAAGYAVVPVEPTLKMNEAGYSAKSVGCWVPDIYKAMLTAAKETP